MLRDLDEIGAREPADAIDPTPRKRRAGTHTPATSPSPAVSPIGQALESDRQQGASPRAMANLPSPLAAIIPGNGVGGEGHCFSDDQSYRALSATITAIVQYQKERVFCIRSQSRSDRSCESFIASWLGFRADLPEKERKAIYARAATMRRAVEKGGHDQGDNHLEVAPDADGEGQIERDSHPVAALSVCTPIITNSARARMAWDQHRAGIEKQMTAAARSLHVHAWQKSVDGFGEVSLAKIVGEAGDIGSYATKERLWKRLGLAVIDGDRQQKRTDKERAAAHGYNPRRRAEIWMIADSMFKHQWAGDWDEDGKPVSRTKKPMVTPAHAVGPYGWVYAIRRVHTEKTHPEWSDAHRNNDARRVMTKALIEDVWRVWRGLPPIQVVA